ncbi:MAG: Gx transporter family protein [Lachnospiraceae bacterium]|nr:Gx transporter family protein [Lachnospiraceae bacterium]
MGKKTVYYGIFTALALLMGYVESLVPVPFPVPGIKLGLTNAVIVTAMYFFGEKEAFFISLIRVMLSGILFAGFGGFLYSFAGALTSFFVMAVFKKLNIFGITGISVLGGVSHNAAQIAVASVVVNNVRLFYYLPPLMVSGVVTGVVIGTVSKTALKHLKNANIKI